MFTWVYRKDEDPFEASARDVAVGKHFYGKSGEIEVDEKITAVEIDYANLVDDLRTRKPGEISSLAVAELVREVQKRGGH